MVRVLLSFLVILSFGQSGLPRDRCQCRPATATDKTIWGHMATSLEEERPLKTIRGSVSDPRGEPLVNALVEIFADDGPGPRPTPDSSKRIAGCVTGEKGKFCFDQLPAGKYVLALGREGFNITLIKLTIDPHDRKSSNKSLHVNLELGT